MKALLDTNIVIHRETNKVVNQDIGMLFKWLDKAKFQKVIHPITVNEIKKFQNAEIVKTFLTKLDSYETLNTTAPMSNEVQAVAAKYDRNQNDVNDSILLNELFCGRVDLLISEDRKLHQKADEISLSDRLFTINSFLEKIYAEYPELVDYTVLSVQPKFFGEINLKDDFFDSLREDYSGFDAWFNRKSNEKAYVTSDKSTNKILSFLYLKKEDVDEKYDDILPRFTPKKRLKVGTFKVVGNGVRLGERFLKIIFDNARTQKVDEIYVTIFSKRQEQLRLIGLLEDWGFRYYGQKTNGEFVYVRDFTPKFDSQNPKLTFPYVGTDKKIFLVPIYPEYHTELMPDSILHSESRADFYDDQPHRNSIGKVYISRSFERNINKGDVLIFYRTGGFYKSVVTTLGIVDGITKDFKDLPDFIAKCRKRSVFTDEKLAGHWNYNKMSRPFIVSFLYCYSFPNRINLKRLIELGVIASIGDAPRGFQQISITQFYSIIKESKADESIIINKA